MGEGNVFTGVCHSVHTCRGSVLEGRGGSALGRRGFVLEGGGLHEGEGLHGGRGLHGLQTTLRHTVNRRSVRILLECILVDGIDLDFRYLYLFGWIYPTNLLHLTSPYIPLINISIPKITNNKYFDIFRQLNSNTSFEDGISCQFSSVRIQPGLQTGIHKGHQSCYIFTFLLVVLQHNIHAYLGFPSERIRVLLHLRFIKPELFAKYWLVHYLAGAFTVFVWSPFASTEKLFK